MKINVICMCACMREERQRETSVHLLPNLSKTTLPITFATLCLNHSRFILLPSITYILIQLNYANISVGDRGNVYCILMNNFVMDIANNYLYNYPP